MLTELDIINDMLRATGTSRLTAQDTQHPAYITANDTLQRVSRSVQAMGLWFNTTYPTLMPNTDKDLIVPDNTLHCDPIDITKQYAVRKRKVYNLKTRSFAFEGAEVFKVVTSLDIEDMPYLARDYIRAMAKYEYYLDEDGGEPKLSNYKVDKDVCWSKLYSEHLKSRDVNYYNSEASRRMGKNYGGFGNVGSRRLPGVQE